MGLAGRPMLIKSVVVLLALFVTSGCSSMGPLRESPLPDVPLVGDRILGKLGSSYGFGAAVGAVTRSRPGVAGASPSPPLVAAPTPPLPPEMEPADPPPSADAEDKVALESIADSVSKVSIESPVHTPPVAAASPPPGTAEAPAPVRRLPPRAEPPRPAEERLGRAPEETAPAARPDSFVEAARVREAIDHFDELLERLPLANIVFDVPQLLRLGERTPIYLRLSLGDSLKELEKSLSPTAAGTKKGAQIHVTDRIEARLTGTAFRIESIRPEVQGIGHETTDWQWEIEPSAPGLQTLHLTVSVLMEVGGTRVLRAIRTFDEKIEIQVSWSKTVADFFKGQWKWLWTAFLVPLVGWLWGKRVRKSRRSPRGKRG